LVAHHRLNAAADAQTNGVNALKVLKPVNLKNGNKNG